MRKKSRFAPSSKKDSPKGRGPQRPAGRGTQPASASKGRQLDDRTFGPRAEPKAARTQIELPKHKRIVIGNHAILEAAHAHPRACAELWLRQGWESSQDLKKIHQELRATGALVQVKPESVIDRFGGSHQGAALFMTTAPTLAWDEIERAAESTLVLLDGIEDPHNLGAVLRTAWLMGVKGILIPEDRAVGLTATVHKVACGGAEHVPVETCTNFTQPLEKLREQGYWIFGLSHEGKKTIFDLKIPEKVVWCIGAEEKGLRSTTERLCDELVRIPQVSVAASYNASVATAIALTETFRQRSSKSL